VKTNGRYIIATKLNSTLSTFDFVARLSLFSRLSPADADRSVARLSELRLIGGTRFT